MLPNSTDKMYLFLLFLQTSLIPQKAGSSLPYHRWVSGSGILWQAACCSSWNWTSTWAQCQMLEEQVTLTLVGNMFTCNKMMTSSQHFTTHLKPFFTDGVVVPHNWIFPYLLLVLVWAPSPTPLPLGHSFPAAVLPMGRSEKLSGWTPRLLQKAHLQSLAAHWVTEE